MQLSSPAPGRPVSSPYGMRRHPVTGKWKLHGGIDYAGRFTVLAAGDGTVVSNAFDATGLGWYVGIEHAPTLRTYYGHGEERSALPVGRRVSEHAPIYPSGETGLATGPHLHFEVRVRTWAGVWVRVNPAPYLTEPPKPTPIVQEDDDMNPKVFKRTQGAAEWSLIAPWLEGASELEQGYLVTADPARGLAWERMYAGGSKKGNNVDRAGYVAAQDEARVLRAQWVADKALARA